ncbi:putative hydrolase M10 [Exophiala dermatitidis]
MGWKSNSTGQTGILLLLPLLLCTTLLTPHAAAECRYQSPAFPAPDYSQPIPELQKAFRQIEASITALVNSSNHPEFNTSSYSIEVTSAQKTLWTTFHTAVDKDPERPGADTVDGSSAYRIASITKTFTVLGILQQQALGNLHLDDPVVKYIPELAATTPTTAAITPGGQNAKTPQIQWENITLHSLASQLSGIPRDWASGDLVTGLPDPTVIGLPPIPVDQAGLPACAASRKDPHHNSESQSRSTKHKHKACTKDDLLASIRTKPPLFAPNQQSTYSNIAFELLGLVLANVTGVNYEESINQTILTPLGMTGTLFTKPADKVAVLPRNISWYWDVDEGVENPTGGLFACSADMSRFLRYVLNHYNDGSITDSLNWFQPASFTATLGSFYGVPWEIFRTNKILAEFESDRVVTFISKGGGLPGYSTIIILVPEYMLGITILTAGSEQALLDLLREAVTVPLIRAADEVARRQMQSIYAGTYKYTDADMDTHRSGSGTSNKNAGLNSSITLTYSTAHGLEITKFISNGTDVLAAVPAYFHLDKNNNIYHLQAVPTTFTRSPLDDQNENETRDGDADAGERWRILLLSKRRDHETKTTAGVGVPVWDDFCITNIDMMAYAGKPFNELVFRNKVKRTGTGADASSSSASFKFGTVELTGFRVSLDRVENENESEPGPGLTDADRQSQSPRVNDDKHNTAACGTGSFPRETSQEQQFIHDL